MFLDAAQIEVFPTPLSPIGRGNAWRFECDAEVFTKSDTSAPTNRRIGGICSTDDLDRQAEKILQDGMDFAPFLKDGWFNDNHDPATDAVVGYPTRAEFRTMGMRKGWYVEGYLLDGHPRADALWMLANALQKTDRRLGFSVEGSVTARDAKNPSVIRKAVVREVAITRCPVNTNTALHVLAKSLSAGSAPVAIAPASATGDGGARVMARRSVEAAAQGSTSPTIERIKKRKKKLSEIEQRVLDKALAGEPITRLETAVLLQTMAPGLSLKQAEAIADFHFKGAAKK
jgi:hypothetical protein